MPSIRLLIIYHTQQESNVVCLSHEGELKFHDVISTLRYCHDICLKALNLPAKNQSKGLGAACSSHATEFFANAK